MNTSLPPILETKLADFRRRVWVVKLAEGLLAGLCGVAISYLLVFVLDRFFETPGTVRGLLLLAVGLGLGLGLPLKWHRWVWKQRRLEDAARLLRRTFPRLGDQLLGIVELARMDSAAAGRSERLVQAAIAQAAEAVKDQDFTRAVPHARHHHWGLAAAGAVAIAVCAFVMVNAAARNALARWITPWRVVERFTFARVKPLPQRLVVPYAEPFALPVALTQDTEWSPAKGTARIAKQPKVTASLESGSYPLAFPPQKQDGKMALSMGDVRKSIDVQPRTRPELEELAVHLRLPSYLEYKSEPRIEVRGGTVSVVKGAEAAFEAKASRPLAAAEVDGSPQQVQGGTILTGYTPVTGDLERKFTWKDLDGLTPRDALLLKVRAVDDEAPKIVARRDNLEQVVLDSEVVTFDVNASDDFGIKLVGLEWVGSEKGDDGKTPVKGEKITAAGESEKKDLAARATFCATREGVAPQTIEIRAWTEDYKPSRERSRSASFILHVLNKTDHALWLTEQFGKWLEVAKESYEREQQLHQSNKELRSLTAAELDRPENRRRVSQQAAAENANAARLDSLTASGRNLVEQATKNDEFDAKRLESWATMLKSLKDIAANRMPSVSDLLKQTAAAGKAPGNANPNQTPGQNPNPNSTPPSNQTAAAPQGAKPQDGKSAPNVSHGDPLAGVPKPAAPVDPNAPPKPVAPSISDREASLGKLGQEEAKPADPNAAPKPPGGGKLRLPTTQLAAAPAKKGEEQAPPPESPAQEKLDNAITEQKDLLAEFAKVSDQLSEILGSLESSTFVKRLKAASRQQMAIATNISQKTLDAFGIEREPVKEAAPIAKHAKDQSEVVHTIESDLEAYFQRKQDARYKGILEDMRKTEIVRALARDGEKVAINLSGQSLIGSEFWADTLDRWSEELVSASNCKSCSSCSGDSLPPEIVLKVMQALRDEMKLREETREMENAKPALERKKYTTDAKELSDKQATNAVHTQSAIKDILDIPEAETKFRKELQLLTAVVNVMDEAEGILDTPETGPTAIAAETEAIELLLQAKRNSPNKGGGGGSNPGGGSGPAVTTLAALADLGPGSNADSVATARPVGQATGRAGKEFPDEFKGGLEAYFNLLEGQAAGK